MNICQHCTTKYMWTKSTSTLKMTYCSQLCERADLGFTIQGIIRAERWMTDPTSVLLETCAMFGNSQNDAER